MIHPMPQPFETPAPRLAPVLHYVIARSDGLGFGAVKLNKTVVRADVEFFRRYGKTITGAKSFQKQRLGPVPNGVVKVLKTLRAESKIAPRTVLTPAGERDEYVALIEPDVTKFTAAEIDVINLSISYLQRLSANQASEESHDALWEEADMFGQIPVRAAAFPPAPIDADTLSWALGNGQ
jgi:hypothetical protein